MDWKTEIDIAQVDINAALKVGALAESVQLLEDAIEHLQKAIEDLESEL